MSSTSVRRAVGHASLVCLGCELLTWVYGAYAYDQGVIAALVTNLPPALWVIPPLLVLVAALWLRHSGSVAWSGAALLIGAFPLGGLSLKLARDARAPAIALLTFNVEKWSHGADAVSRVIQSTNPDVFCLEEAGYYHYVRHMAEERRTFDTRLASYRLERAGEIIVGTRLPVLRTNRLPLPPGPESRPLLEVLVRTPNGGELSVLSAHLLYTGYFSLSPRGVEQAAQARLQQAERISEYAASLGHPAVLCGDLNSGFRSAALLNLTNRFRDAWRERGLGFGLSYSTTLRSRRVDYVLVNGLEVASIHVVDVEASDHYPLLAVLEMPQAR